MTQVAKFVELVSIEEAIAELYTAESVELERLIPFADIQHIGSTAIRGSITKGDLDISVCVLRSEFPEASEKLDSYASRHADSLSTHEYQPYIKATETTDVGIQLFVSGSVFEQRFLVWRDMLRSDATLLAKYNSLKEHYEGSQMSAYREAKASFISKHHPAAA